MSNQRYTLKVPSGTTHFFWASGHSVPSLYKRCQHSNLFMIWNMQDRAWRAPLVADAAMPRTLALIENIQHHTPVTCSLEYEEPEPELEAIDWELAPRATHFLHKAGNCGMYADTFWRIDPSTRKAVEAWRVENDGKLMHFGNPICVRLEELIARPPLEWDGEGIPPEGTICEALSCRTNTYRKCEVVAIRDGAAIVLFPDHDEIQWAKHFKPLRTFVEREADDGVQPLEWDGDGLPPVGIECEVRKSTDTRWHRVTILVHFMAGKTVAVYAPVDGPRDVGQATAECFRPILTPRQLQLAKARELVVQEMMRVIEEAGASTSPADQCEALYNAGYGHKVMK